MNLEPDILDATDIESKRPQKPRWLINLVVASLVFSILGGLSLSLLSEITESELIFSWGLFLMLVIALVFTGKFLAQSPLKTVGFPLLVITLIQASSIMTLMVNSFYFSERFLSGRPLTSAGIVWPNFHDFSDVLMALLLFSIYSSWVILSVSIFRRLYWKLYLIIAIVYSGLVIWSLFVNEVLGPI
ncbi:MAG: hypothetical protein AAF433_19575 [Bacteroidota bacterium]